MPADITMVELESRVGHAWRYHCRRCGHEVDLLAAFPETCPGCGAGGWWGKLTTTGGSATSPTMSEYSDELWRATTDSPMHESGANNGILAAPLTVTRGRGRPFMPTPDDLITELAAEGYGCRRIADELGLRGEVVSPRTVARRMKALVN